MTATKPAFDTYDSVGRAFHWTVVVLLAIQFGTAMLLPDIRMDTAPDTTINLHFNVGLAILLVMAARLVHRWSRPVRAAPSDPSRLSRGLALATHWLFYVILLVGPFAGWASASAHGLPVKLLGLVPLPELASRKAPWALLAGDVHIWTMWTLLALIVLHVGAALYHHFVRHDGVLRRMLPGLKA